MSGRVAAGKGRIMDERVIIAYDVADDRRRYHLCKTLERYGIRIQYSIFELSLKPKDLYKLVDHLTGLIDNTEDRLLVMQLCGGCLHSMGRYGNMTSYSPEETLII
jgi:CRISPR-associated protein Cas2